MMSSSPPSGGKLQRGSQWIPAFAGMTVFSLMSYGLQPTAWATEDLTGIQGDFLQGDYQSVLSQTEKMIPHASASQRDALLYLQGISALKLWDLPLAKSSLEHLLNDHPKSPFAAQGSAALNEVNQQMSRPASQPPQPAESLFIIQVGAFSAKANALRLQKELRRRGYDAFVNESAGAENLLYRVRVGRFASRQEAEKICDRLRSDGFPAQVKP